MGILVTHHFLFTTEVITPLKLDEHSGSALRGNFFQAVWERFCNNKASPTCADCPLHAMCPVSTLVAPLREESERGRDIPRPYIILPPMGKQYYEPGSQLIFGITLFGTIVQLFPYIILAANVLEAKGLGHKLDENHGQRGRFKIQQIESYNPVSAVRQVVYQEGKPRVSVPAISVMPTDVLARAGALPTDKITINFLTPTRILYKEKLVHHAAFGPLVQRLLERLTALELAYGYEGEEGLTSQWREMVELAGSVECSDDCTRWEELQSYSGRQRRSTPIGGIIGKATFVGDLAPFRELLVWGELIHVGKNAVKGNGLYRIES